MNSSDKQNVFEVFNSHTKLTRRNEVEHVQSAMQCRDARLFLNSFDSEKHAAGDPGAAVHIKTMEGLIHSEYLHSHEEIEGLTMCDHAFYILVNLKAPGSARDGKEEKSFSIEVAPAARQISFLEDVFREIVVMDNMALPNDLRPTRVLDDDRFWTECVYHFHGQDMRLINKKLLSLCTSLFFWRRSRRCLLSERMKCFDLAGNGEVAKMNADHAAHLATYITTRIALYPIDESLNSKFNVFLTKILCPAGVEASNRKLKGIRGVKDSLANCTKQFLENSGASLPLQQTYNQALVKILDANINDIITKPAHPVYELLCLFLFAYFFESATNVEFEKKYIVTPVDYENRLDEITDDVATPGPPRIHHRPRIIILSKETWVVIRTLWYKVSSPIAAAALWCLSMSLPNFLFLLENRMCIKHFIETFLPVVVRRSS
jgi:hypothetical protein